MISVSDDDILQMKESKFELFVELASKTFGLQYKPRIFFIDGRIPNKPDTKTDIDVATATIRVSRGYLINTTDEVIKETAFHEVTHMFNTSHNQDFKNKLSDTLTGIWQPLSGVIAIDGGRRIKTPTEKISEPEIDDKRCNYHDCRTKDELIECEHCGRYFCNEHITPNVPSFPNFNNPDYIPIRDKNYTYHPCANYYDYLQMKEKEQRRRYSESLDRMSGKHRRTSEYYYKEEIIVEEKPSIEPEIEEEPEIETDEIKNEEEKKKQNYCTECGGHIKPEYKFCVQCGNKL